MNVNKIFAKFIKNKANGKSSCVYTDYETARQILKYLSMLPESKMACVVLEDWEYDGYDDLFVVTYDEENCIWCQKAKFENGNIARSSGTNFVYLDSKYIKEDEYNNYVADDECVIKAVK